MQRLTEMALEQSAGGVFTLPEVAYWGGGGSNRRFGLLGRALRAGEVVRIHRGLYCLADKYLRRKIDPLVVAQRIRGPSYISLETALSYHGWIPEAVYTVTSACMDRSREFATPLGVFSFTRIPQETFYTEVTRVEGAPGEAFLLASPLKALCDYVYARRLDWDSSRPVVGSLRVEEEDLATVKVDEFDRLVGNYSSRRVRRFLEGLRKDVGR